MEACFVLTTTDHFVSTDPLSRWYVLRTRMTQRWFPLTLECTILVLSIPCWNVTLYHPCIILHPLSAVFWRRQYLSLDERQQWEGWSNASHCPQVPRHPTTWAPNYNAFAPNIQYKSCLQELKAVGFCSAMFRLKYGRMIPQGLCLSKAMKEHSVARSVWFCAFEENEIILHMGGM